MLGRTSETRGEIQVALPSLPTAWTRQLSITSPRPAYAEASEAMTTTAAAAIQRCIRAMFILRVGRNAVGERHRSGERFSVRAEHGEK